jgi:cytochrome oxidase Cu insertion factor (SCO1/SenC/PrrC family)
MEKKARIAVIGFIAVFLGTAGVFFAQKTRALQPLAATVKKLPDFVFRDLNGDDLASTALPEGKKVIVQFFSPSCELCHYETKEYLDNYGLLDDNVTVLFVSSDREDEVKTFVKEQQLAKYPRIQVMLDTRNEVQKFPDYAGAPSTYIYDENGLLVKKFRSEVKFGAILPYIKSL